MSMNDIYPEDNFHHYTICSTSSGDPEDVSIWCETDMLRKAEAVFDLLKTHRERIGIRYLALINEHTGTLLRCDGKA